MKKKILIISQLRPNFFKGEKTNILYFNEGCKPYKENFKNHLIVNYKFNAKKLIKDYKYLLNIYEIYLEIIYKKFNLLIEIILLNMFMSLNYIIQFFLIKII